MAPAKKTLGLRRNLREEERRDQIKEAAISLFSANGYQQSTMDDLAEAAGVSKSLIYWYWEGKAALLSELVDNCMQPYIDQLTAAVASEEPFIKKLYQYLWDFLDLFRKSDRLNKLVHFCSVHTAKNEKENFAEQVNNHYNSVMALIEKLVEQAVEEGYLPKESDFTAISLTIMSMVEGFIYMSILEDRSSLDRLIVSVFQLILRNKWLSEDQPGRESNQ